jgi:protein phosphatase
MADSIEFDRAAAASQRAPRGLATVAAGATDIGRRAHNEDHVLLRPELGLFLLADGAGGHNAGNVASALATTTAANVFETSAKAFAGRPDVDAVGLATVARRLSAAIHRANAEIIEIAKKTERYRGMGTTLVALAFAPDGCVHVAHVGDSRCYRLRGGHVEPLTTDHSLLVDVLEGHPDADDALLARTPQHVVTRALGMDESVRVTLRSLRVLAGDLYLLCSDGLSDALGDVAIEQILARPATPDELVHELLHDALEAGVHDNVAAVVVACPEADVALARRPSMRPLSPSSPPPLPLAMRAPMESTPEIIIVGVETHVVPADSADPKVLDALGRLSRLRQPGSDLTLPRPVQCAGCGQPLEKGAVRCPTCDRALAAIQTP